VQDCSLCNHFLTKVLSKLSILLDNSLSHMFYRESDTLFRETCLSRDLAVLLARAIFN